MRGLEKPYADRSHFLIFYRPCCYGISDKLYIYINVLYLEIVTPREGTVTFRENV